MVKFDMPMPESCFWDCWLTDRIVCFATPEERQLEDVGEFDKPAWCPLKDCPDESKTNVQDRMEGDSMNDNVSHPSHYCRGGIECIDAIRASMSPEAFAGYCKGNCLKYLWRYDQKAGIEDLKKTRMYLEWLIQTEEARSDG